MIHNFYSYKLWTWVHWNERIDHCLSTLTRTASFQGPWVMLLARGLGETLSVTSRGRQSFTETPMIPRNQGDGLTDARNAYHPNLQDWKKGKECQAIHRVARELLRKHTWWQYFVLSHKAQWETICVCSTCKSTGGVIQSKTSKWGLFVRH